MWIELMGYIGIRYLGSTLAAGVVSTISLGVDLNANYTQKLLAGATGAWSPAYIL